MIPRRRYGHPFRLAALSALPLAAMLSRAAATPELAPLFRDHAVLQSGKPVPVWGTGAPGEHMSVSFAGQSVGATTAADGRWTVVLSPLVASAAGADLSVKGASVVVIRDVCVGEVWLCAGQSAREPASGGASPSLAGNGAAEFASVRPLLRRFRVGRLAQGAPAESAAGAWSDGSPGTAGQFAAAGGFFARDIGERIRVPVGLIDATGDAAPLVSWMSRSALAGFPALREGRTRPGALFNGLIHPLLPYAIRGVLWLPGDASGRADDYEAQFLALVTSWRSHFGQGDIPFFWVQLGSMAPAGDSWDDRVARIREAQSRALILPATGQAVAIDLGEASNPLARSEEEVGRRLALIAKARVYGIAVDCSGPVFSSVLAEGSSLRVRFAFAGDGLTASGGPLQAFEVAGADRVFHPASAVIQGDTIIVRAPKVAQPVAVRYAWRSAPGANLYNGAGLPAAPFRSDAW